MSATALPSNRRRAPPPPGVNRKTSTDGGPNYDELKVKYLTVDRNYENLKQLTRKGTGCVVGIDPVLKRVITYPCSC